ncbi:hypothetical protein [Sphingobium sp. B11D3D]|uniref:hypothetical protein n=1 Tax=Sphingobium sp. B11D3D TaxID=2940576 RepID=UPI002225885C|nr:hypothetical protein [Sphingobium sp. B11D3D]
MIAVPASHEAPQREIDMNVRPHRRERLPGKPFLNLVEGGERYDCFVLTGPQRNVPFLALDIARIDRARHDPARLFIRQIAVTTARELRMRFEEALDLRLGVETP